MYFTLYNCIKHIVETNREYHKTIQMNNNDLQDNLKQQAIDELNAALKTDYIYLFNRIQLQ